MSRRSRSSRNFGGRKQRGQKGSSPNNHQLRGGTRGLRRGRPPVEGVWCNGDTDCHSGCYCMNGGCWCKGTYVTDLSHGLTE